MTTREDGRDDRPDNFDWTRAEAQLTAEVVELDARRGGRKLVDSVEAQSAPRLSVAGLKAGQRRPIVPGWLRTREQIRDTARWTIGHVTHAGLYHLTRSPKYAVKLAVRAPRGAVRVVMAVARWWWDAEGEPVRQAAATHADAETYLKLSRQRDARVRWRGLVVTVVALVGVPVIVAGLILAGPSVRWLLLAVAVGGFGVAGAPADRPLLDTAVVVPRVARLTSDVVVRALSVLGIAGISQALGKNPKAIGFAAPITRDGPGWRADIDLPFGTTAAEVIERRDKLAAGLTRPLGCVWPEANHEVHPGRLVLWVADQDMSATKPPVWPLARAGTVDLSKPFPFGTDPRGRHVPLELAYTNVLIGSIPGYGKTFSLRLPMLAAALDPQVEIWTFELKGSGDLESLEKVSARYASGDDDDVADLALLALRDLRRECTRRAKVIKGLPKSVCPENKVTAELARRKGLGLHWLVVGIDECQNLFAHPVYGKEAGELAERIIKLGRALGIILLLATQRPDAKSLPTGVSANVGTRYCLRVMGQMENDMILGTSAYRNGIRATMLGKKDKGVGYLVGAGDDTQIVRTFYIDNPTAEAICARARAAREAARTVIGHAAGQEPEVPALRRDTLLDDLLAVLPVDEPKAWTETVLDRLTATRPEIYAGLTREQLTAALKPHGITTGQVWGTDPDTGKGANRRGIERADITTAVTERNGKRRAG